MSTFARRAAVGAAGLALAATLSPVAQADGRAETRASASRGSYIELTAYTKAPVYAKPSSSSKRLGTVQAGEKVRVWCQVKGPSGNIWYAIQDLAPGGHYVWSGHFISLAHPPKSC
ncbi:SH3 domain-containing protein [Streptomyces sp. NPDC057555]|uniref:SH3 domain-containing protein n=1 Tax=Streptomyces sp. NPDC057555 TaxID=3346166 RepID=UPI0036C9F5DF